MEFLKHCVMMDNINSRIIDVDEHWKTKMPMMAMEELAECIQAISKCERRSFYYKDGTSTHDEEKLENLKKEIADVYISLYAIMQHYDISGSDIEDLMNLKLRKNYRNAVGEAELRMMIYDYCEQNDISSQTATRMFNSLIRNKIDSVESLIWFINDQSSNGEIWYNHIRYLGKECAKHIEEMIRNKNKL